jgi:dihydrofolate synthase/folylpolyglutamate synthase
VAITATCLSPHEWAALYRRDDGEQQPISPVEREFGLEAQARRHGLELMRPLLRALGDPLLSYPTIHVGGSKGKGSTVAILSAMLQAAGYRVGSYVSPSLTHFGERIAVNDQPLSDAEAEQHVAELLRALRRVGERPRFFEAATAIAFRHFAQAVVDIAVIEVGLGGLRDATNVIMPEVAIITSIELEHTQILGDTLTQIACEKAGIIKPGVPVLTAVSEPEALEPIEQAAAERGAPLRRLGRHFGVEHSRLELTEQRFDLWLGAEMGARRLDELVLGLAGAAQSSNAALATAAACLLRPRFDRLTDAAIREGLRQARWPGRLELRDARPRVLLDVAHTPASAAQLRRHLDRFFPDAPKTLVIGVLRDKNAAALAEQLGPAFDVVIAAPVKWFRSMEPAALEFAFRTWCNRVQVAPSICAGIELAKLSTPPDGLIVVAGSVFAVGEAKRRFGWL